MTSYFILSVYYLWDNNSVAIEEMGSKLSSELNKNSFLKELDILRLGLSAYRHSFSAKYCTFYCT